MSALRWVLSAVALYLLTGCTFVGQGEGEVFSTQLFVEECWRGPYDLDPDFFAAVPYRDTTQIRLQRGSDLQEVSDGVAIQVNDVPDIRQNFLGQPLAVGLHPKLLNEIAPGVETGLPPPVNLALYLQFSCHNQISHRIKKTPGWLD